MYEEICGKVAPGLCRLAPDGSIAVKTPAGYRTYNVENKRLTNCDRFVLDIGEDFFFVVPTSHAAPGDIILAGGRPRCVLSADDTALSVLNFDDQTVETLVPEHHMFMGGTYLFGKVVSLLGRNGVRGKDGAKRMMKMMILSGLMKGKDAGGSPWLPLLLLGGGDGLMDLDGLFDEEDGREEA